MPTKRNLYETRMYASETKKHLKGITKRYTVHDSIATISLYLCTFIAIATSYSGLFMILMQAIIPSNIFIQIYSVFLYGYACLSYRHGCCESEQSSKSKTFWYIYIPA